MRGSTLDVKNRRLRRQILTSKVDPRTVRVNPLTANHDCSRFNKLISTQDDNTIFQLTIFIYKLFELRKNWMCVCVIIFAM